MLRAACKDIHLRHVDASALHQIASNGGPALPHSQLKGRDGLLVPWIGIDTRDLYEVSDCLELPIACRPVQWSPPFAPCRDEPFALCVTTALLNQIRQRLEMTARGSPVHGSAAFCV